MCKIHGGSKSRSDAPDLPVDVVSRLRNFDFLSALSPSELRAVAECGSFLRLPADCMVDEQAEQGSSMYLLLAGRVRFWVDDVDMRDITLGYASAPQFFGELCFLSPGRRSTNVTTCSEVELLQLESEDLVKLAALCPDFVRVLTGEVVERCRGNVETLQNTVFRTAKERVMNALLVITRESQYGGQPATHPRRLGLDAETCVVQGYTHEDIASMAFTTRETVTRTLAELEREGVIESRSAGWLRIRPAMIKARLGSGAIDPMTPVQGTERATRAVS